MQLKVITLNAWGLWLVSKRREERMHALAAWLRGAEECAGAEAADVVALQEVWVNADVEVLRDAAAASGLPFSFHFHSGVIGTGLLILSRHPILEAAYHPFSARGDPGAFYQGDWLAGKGAGWVLLQVPGGGTISVFTSHLSANYEQRWAGAKLEGRPCRLPRDGLAGVRVLQMLELAAFVRARAGAGSPGSQAVVLAGDLNAAPDTLEMRLLQALLPELADCWAVARPREAEGGATANAPECTFSTVGAGSKRHAPIRIDYCLSSASPLSAQLTLADTGRGFSYSDHLGLAVVLNLSSSSSGGNSTVIDGSSSGSAHAGGRPGSAGGGRSHHVQSSTAVARRRRAALARAADCLAAAEQGMQRQRRASAIYGLLLLVALTALLASCVGHAGAHSALRSLVIAAGAGLCGLGAAALLLLTVARSLELSAFHQAQAQVALALGVTL